MFQIMAGDTLFQQNDLAQVVARANVDPTAFKPIYEEFFPRIYRYCLRRVGSAQEAEDLSSQIFTRALSGLSSYRGGSFPAWLFRIAHNAVVNHLRARRTTIDLEQAAQESRHDETLGRLIESEELDEIKRLVAALPDEQRELFALRINGGLSAKEIGQVVGKSEGAVRVAIHRTLQQLRAATMEMNQ